VGATVAGALATAFRSMDALAAATPGDLTRVPEIGEKIARSVIRFFADQRNRTLVERLRQAGLQFALPDAVAPAAPVTGVLAGKTIVISGVFRHHSRDEYKALIERHGGTNASSISSRTAFVLAGDNMGPAKRQKAATLGIPLVDEQQFLDMIL